MAEKYFCVYDQQEQGNDFNDKREFKSAKLLLEDPKIARFVKVEAESVAEAQEAIRNLFPGRSSGTTVVVTEAAWKTS